MTHPSRSLTATLIFALALSSFSYGLAPVRADDPTADTSVVTDTSAGADAAVSTPDVPDTSAVSDTSVTPGADLAASSTPDQTDQAATADTADTAEASSTSALSDTPNASSTPDLPFDSVSAFLTGSSTASSTLNISSSTVPVTSTTTTATSTGPTIQSGEAVALANILNIVNTNLVNSVGDALLLNYTAPVTGPIDLRTGTPVFSTSTPVCALIACAGTGGISVNLSGGADIHNALVLNATSGGNDIDMGSTTGQATINTGNAYAGLNLINVANTNIVDSNYLLVTMNAFQGVNGDIIFPSLTNLLSSLGHNLSGSISMTSDGSVANNVSTDASTGGNGTENTASSTVTTGSANSRGSVFNQINTNLIGGSSVAILFRIQGTWAGNVFGAPAGLEWTQGPNGMLALFNSDPAGTGGGANLAQLTASSTANIDNNVSVVALTGDNLIKNANAALITTGNALASANVLNIANTNVIGKNWIMAIINIFGDFSGNISFGRPDLWVGEQVSVPSFIGNGSSATYKFTVINNGDAPASNVQLNDAFDQAHISVATSSAAYTTDSNGHLVWDLGTIPPKGAVEVTYQGTVENTQPDTDVTDTVNVSETEPDNNLADNTDTATFTTTRLSSSGSSSHTNKPKTDANVAPVAHLTVTRSVPDSTSVGGTPVHQVVTVANDSSAASIPLVVHDVLTASDGTQIYDQAWNIGSLAADDAVQLAYDAQFSSNAPIGTYVLSTVIYDEQENELGHFVGNGTITLTPASSSTHRLFAPLSAYARKHTGGSGDVLSSVIPGVAIANAAETGNQAAATGFLSISWPFLLAIFLVLLGLLALLAWYRRREQYR